MLHGTSTSRALAGIQIYKKECVEGGRYGTRYRYLFPCPGIIVVSVDKATSSSHMDAENAINLGKKMKERWKGRAISTVCMTRLPPTASIRYAVPPLVLLFLLRHVMQLCPVDVPIRAVSPISHHQDQYSAASSAHPHPPRPALALPRHPSSACQEGKETARTSPVEVAAAWILSQSAQTIEAAVLVRWRWRWKWNRKICPESSW